MKLEDMELRIKEIDKNIKAWEEAKSSSELQIIEDEKLSLEYNISILKRRTEENGIGKRFIYAQIEDFETVEVKSVFVSNSSISTFLSGKEKDQSLSYFKPTNVNIVEVLKSYSDNFCTIMPSGNSMVLFGPHGTGKTHASCALAMACAETYKQQFRKLLDYYFIRMSDLMYYFSCKDKNKDVEKIRSKDFLIIDEIGSEKHSESGWTVEQFVNRILRFRYDNCLPTILTTNSHIGDFARMYGERASTVLLGQSFKFFGMITKEDLRKKF